MKKIIITIIMLISIITIPGVKADDMDYYCSNSVNKIISGNFIKGYVNPFGTPRPSDLWQEGRTYNGIIEVKEKTAYQFKFMTNPTSYNPRRILLMYYNSNKELISYSDTTTQVNYIKNFTTPENTKYLVLVLYNVNLESSNNVASVLYDMTEYGNTTITEPIIEYEKCLSSGNNEENEVYSTFISLYTDRLNYLAEGFTSNPYLIAMIGIIFAFIVLELFLKILHLRGGK